MFDLQQLPGVEKLQQCSDTTGRNDGCICQDHEMIQTAGKMCEVFLDVKVLGLGLLEGKFYLQSCGMEQGILSSLVVTFARRIHKA